MRKTGKEYKADYYAKWFAKKQNEPNLLSNDSELGKLAKRSQVEVAKIMGISRQAVHQIERKALMKMRAGLLPIWREWQGK